MFLKVNICIPSAILLILAIIYFTSCSCYPVKEDTTTPKIYKDRFVFKKEFENITEKPPSFDGHFRPNFKFDSKYKIKDENPNILYQIKSVMPGEKTMRQGDDDDDDDDDGGEYEGFGSYSLPKSKSSNEGSCRKKPIGLKQDSVPMMIIRELDMVAMEFPLGQKSEWSEWSPCSKPCGDGVQTRSRQKLGAKAGKGFHPEREQQIRPCHLADCDDSHFIFDKVFI